MDSAKMRNVHCELSTSFGVTHFGTCSVVETDTTLTGGVREMSAWTLPERVHELDGVHYFLRFLCSFVGCSELYDINSSIFGLFLAYAQTQLI